VGRANGYRLPLDAGPLLRTLAAIGPDVVLLHDAHWSPTAVVRLARDLGVTVIAVHHGSAAAGAIGRPGPRRAWRRGLSASQRRLYQRVDAVMAPGALPPEAAGVAHIPLRYGVDPAFRPRPSQRGRHVLFAGRLSPEKGIELLLDAIAAGPSGRTLQLVGHGPSERALRRRAARLGLRDRVAFQPFLDAPFALARAYAEAGCVVVPGAYETFGLVALEAAASGAAVVASSAVPSAHVAGALVHRFPAGDAHPWPPRSPTRSPPSPISSPPHASAGE
jgi:alpha-1,6-mannosyltransferase